MAEQSFEELDKLAARRQAAREARVKDRPSRQIWPWIVVAILISFALGLIGSPWFEREARSHLPDAFRSEAVPAPDPRVDGVVERLERLEMAGATARPALPQADGREGPLAGDAADARLLALEARAADLTASVEMLAAEHARTSNALMMEDVRMRDIFLLAVTRRMMETGRPLTPLEPALNSRYGEQERANLEALLAWSRAPQTRQTLSARLSTLQTVAARNDNPADLWSRVKAGFGRLITVREEGGGVPASFAAQTEKAELALAAGDTALAIAALQPLPQTAPVRQWIADARLLADADAALGRLEAAAIETAVAAVSPGPAPVASAAQSAGPVP